MSAVWRQRLPCVALFLWAAGGVLLGRHVPLDGAVFAVAAVPALLAGCLQRTRFLLPAGVALVFAAAQAWSYRESPAVRLAVQLAEHPQSCTATFVVLEEPRRSRTVERCRFRARLESLEIGGRVLPAGCPAIVSWNGPAPVYGGAYRARASIRNCLPQRNPGTFDYTAWLANAGIRSELEVRRAADAELERVAGNPLVRFAIASRAWVERTIALGIEGTPEAVLIKGMTVGDVSDAPPSLEDAFRETGTFHLFSVSGLHVGIVAGLIWAVLAIFGVGQRPAVLILIPCLFFYALLTGLSAASVRAAIMLSVIAASLLVDRPAIVLNSLGAAGVLLLAADSSQLFNAGFQLSFGAVAMICLVAMPIRRRLGAFVEPDPFLPPRLIPPWKRFGYATAGGSALLLAVSFAAWIATLPLILFYFHLVPLASIPANLLAVPLSTLVLALAAISMAAGLVSPWLAEVFNHANFLLAKIVLALVQAFASAPGSAIYVGTPLPAGALARLEVLDAGRGGAQVLFSARQTWLVDGGSEFFVDSVTIPFLRTSGVGRLDALVLTHGDTQHIGGTTRILEAMKPRLVLDSGLPDRSPTRRRILATTSTQTAHTGSAFPIDSVVRVEVLHPPADAASTLADDKAVVLRVEVGSFSALLMSDAGVQTDLWLLAHRRDRLPCDLVVAGRHISGLSCDENLLRAAATRAIIATADAFPESERLRPEWLRAVEHLGIALLRQDETGAVSVTVREDSFTLAPFLRAGGPSRTFPNAPDPLR
jgi:ComEC/Rec2-related protein